MDANNPLDALKDELFRTFGDFRRMPMHMVAGFDLPVGEFMALQRIHAQGPPWECSVSYLCDGARVTMSAVSQSLASLERKGYVKRSMSELDRRRITVSLTPEGLAFLRPVNRRLERIMRRTIERYGEAELWVLFEQVRRLHGVMDRARLEVDSETENETAMESEGENKP